MAIEVRPASEFDDVAAVLGPKRADANVCWCLSYRLTSSKENRSLKGRERGDRVRELVGEDPPPGVLAYDGADVVGWAAVHPRGDTSFARSRKIPHLDELRRVVGVVHQGSAWSPKAGDLASPARRGG